MEIRKSHFFRKSQSPEIAIAITLYGFPTDNLESGTGWVGRIGPKGQKNHLLICFARLWHGVWKPALVGLGQAGSVPFASASSLCYVESRASSLRYVERFPATLHNFRFAKNIHGLLRDSFWIFPDFSRFFSGVEKSIFYEFFYDEKIDFFMIKKAGNSGIKSETTRESRVRR